MKNKKTLSTIIVLAICLSLSLGLSYLAAGTWNEPTSTADSREVPVNATDNSQAKTSGLSVTSLLVNREAEFYQRVFFRGNVNGGAPGAISPTLKIGGDDGTTEYSVVTNVEGDMKAVQELGSVEIVTAEKNRLCGDDEGHVVFCPQYPSVGLGIMNASVQEDFSSGGQPGFSSSVCLNMAPQTSQSLVIQYVWRDETMNTSSSSFFSHEFSPSSSCSGPLFEFPIDASHDYAVESWCIIPSPAINHAPFQEC